MLLTLLVVLVVSGALLAGATWGIFGTLPTWTDGFLVALAGGALLTSVTTELIQPSIEKASLGVALAGVALGAVLFAVCDYLVDEKWGSDSGGGLLAEHVPWLVRAGVRAFHVDEQVRPGGSRKAYVDAALTRSWRLLLDDATARA